jgi:Putative Ig domain
MRPAHAAMTALLLTGLLGGCGGGGTTTSSGKPSPSPPAGLKITTTSLSGAIVGVPYSTTLGADGGTRPYKWDAPRGLGQGWSLSEAGVLSGTHPLSYGGDCCLPITVRVTDSANPPESVTEIITLNIFGLLPTGVGAGRAGVQFEQIFIASGGKAPISWTPSGTPPPGLSFREDSAAPLRQYDLVGTPTEAGQYEFSITVSDSSSPRLSQTVDYPMQVFPPFLELPHAILPPGVVGQGYDYAFSFSGGAPPYSWSISINSGQLPSGLQLDTVNGRLFGTPTAAGYASLWMSLTDSSPPYPQHVNQTYWVLITPEVLPPRNNSIADATPIFPGTYDASISPYTDPSGSTGPDEDYYQLTARAGTILYVAVRPRATSRPSDDSTLDPVVEILDAYGQRYTTCRDTYDDYVPPGLPIPLDSTPNEFDDPCMNHLLGPDFLPSHGAELSFQVPGDSGDVTFYIHVFDYRGDARPDMFYTLYVQ